MQAPWLSQLQQLLIILVVPGATGLPIARDRRPEVHTQLGVAVGAYSATGVERYGSIPYAVPPLGPRRFARAEVNTAAWPGGVLNATRPSAPCLQTPIADPRSQESLSGPPTEDCLTLDIFRPVPRVSMSSLSASSSAASTLSRPSESSREGSGDVSLQGSAKSQKSLLPVMAYLFGGGLCTGWAGDEGNNGSSLALQHDIVVAIVNYRLGALGYLVGNDTTRPGSGGMNGLHDVIVALQWLKQHVSAFGGSPNDVTLFGQSSGGYSVCTLCVAPQARGLFHRAILQSGPCLGGPPGKGWGPMRVKIGTAIAQEVLKKNNVTDIEGLRAVPAEQVQWPSEWLNDLSKAPYFPGYFEDSSVVPGATEDLWRRGAINPSEILINYNSKDGTAAFYGTSPTLGLVPGDQNTSTPEGYKKMVSKAWGPYAERVLQQYPISSYPSIPSAFLQADADAFVICPLRRIVKYATASGRRVWASEFAHFMPSLKPPLGCEGQCQGFGCDNGVELDVVPGYHAEATRLWATHGAEVRYVFGVERSPDGLGPPHNVTFCTFDPAERELHDAIMGRWATFARYGDPATGWRTPWPAASISSSGNLTVWRQRWAVKKTDGEDSSQKVGINEANCAFWETLFEEDQHAPMARSANAGASTLSSVLV